MDKKISVIVPVYNVEKYVARCLESILAQTYSNFELIIIDDGSTDCSGKICEEYEKKDRRITLIHQENQGLSVARNTGIDIAKGEYYTFIDSDDIVSPHYLKELLITINRNSADVSVCGIVIFDEENEIIYSDNFEGTKIYDGKKACEKIYESNRNQANYVIACGKMYKKELFSKHRYPIGKIHEDQFLTYKLLYNSAKVVEIGKCLYGYYLNTQGITHSPFGIKRYDDIEALEEAEQFFAKHNEHILEEKVKTKRYNKIAEYSLRARKAGIYNLLPKQYRMSFWRAKNILQKTEGIENYEYKMFQIYPRLIKFEAYLRKIKELITRKK